MSAATMAYLIQANRDMPIYLCVQDGETGTFHRFEIDPLSTSRLGTDCALVVNRHLGSYNNLALK